MIHVMQKIVWHWSQALVTGLWMKMKKKKQEKAIPSFSSIQSPGRVLLIYQIIPNDTREKQSI